MLGVDAGQPASEVGEDVVLAFEHDASRSVRACDEAFAGFESGGSEFNGRNGDLVLRADRRGPASPLLYIRHEGKDNSTPAHMQRRCGERLSIGRQS